MHVNSILGVLKLLSKCVAVVQPGIHCQNDTIEVAESVSLWAGYCYRVDM